MNKEKIKIGEVYVEAGHLIVCDPSFIESEWGQPEGGQFSDFGDDVYRHKATSTLWQYTYGEKPQEGVSPIPGHYEEIIPVFGKSANDLIKSGEFEKTDIDPTPHVPVGEFSHRGICKTKRNLFGQLNFFNGNAGVAVAFSTGIGEGLYEVFAEIEDFKELGKRITKIWIEFIPIEDHNFKIE